RLCEVLAAEPYVAVRAAPGLARQGRRGRAMRRERVRDGAAERRPGDAADHREHHVRGYEMPRDEAPDRGRRDRLHAADRPGNGMRERLGEESLPRALVQEIRRILLAAADLVDDDAAFLGEALVRHGRMEELLGEQREGRFDVVVEDLEVN